MSNIGMNKSDERINYKKYLLLLLFCVCVIKVELNAQVSEGILLNRWSVDTLVATSAHNNTYNEIWGLNHQGREYAVIGSTYGTHFIDVTEDNDAKEVTVVKGGSIGRQLVHRDFHDYGGYLYSVAQEGSTSTLQIIDYSFLPDSVHVVYDSDEFIATSHNIFIDSATAMLYSCINTDGAGRYHPLRVFDISNPTDPKSVAGYDNFNGFFVSQVHDCFIKDNRGFLNCGPHGFAIVDVTKPDSINLQFTLEPNEYQQSGYNHSGWPSEDGQYYFMADENWGLDIKVMDVSTIPDVEIIDFINAGSTSNFTIPHNQIVYGQYLYSSYYYDGLQVWDISDINNIQRVLQYSTSDLNHRNRYEGAWGVYPFLNSGKILVSDMQNGLFVLAPALESILSDQNFDINSDFTVYPNPSNGLFEIKGHDLETFETIKIFNTSGQIVFSGPTQKQYNLKIPNGVYLLHLSNRNFTVSKKIVIEH